MQLKEPSFLKVSIILELFVIALAVSLYGWNIEGLQAVTRFSGRLSLLLFAVMFLSPKHRFFGVFAIVHGIHLIELLAYIYLSQRQLKPVSLAGGMIAYAMIFTMPFIKESHKHYNLIVRVYLYYVAFIFLITILPKLITSPS